MAKPKEENRAALPPAPKLVMVLGLIAYFISLYLVVKAWKGDAQLAGCGGEIADCGSVIQTKWGKWFGIPVSGGALLVYGLIAIFAYQMRTIGSRTKWLFLLFLSIVASISALWFIGLQLIEVKSYCLYCMAVHACGVTIAILVIRRFPWAKTEHAKRKGKDHNIPGAVGLRAVFAGLAVVLALAAGQLYSSGTLSTNSAAGPVSNSTLDTAAKLHGREVELVNGKMQFNTSEFPVFGSPQAANVVAHFFDFTCPACRQFHSTLMKAHNENSTETALVMIPVPLDAACNPTVNKTAYIHLDACNFARIGLALWNIAPQKYANYDAFLFGSQQPPSGDAARSMADQLAGAANMERALADPQISNVMRKGLLMFYSPAVPQKILPALATASRVVLGFPEPGVLPKVMAGN